MENNFISWALSPKSSFSDSKRVRKVKLLNNLLIIVIVFLLLGSLSTSTGNGFKQFQISTILLLSAMFLFIPLVLNRTNYDHIAKIIVILILTVIPFATWIYQWNSDIIGYYKSFIWIPFTIMIASFLYDVAGTVFWSSVNLVGVIIIPFLFSNIDNRMSSTFVYFLVPFSVIAVMGTIVRNMDMNKIEVQSAKLKVEEERLRELIEKIIFGEEQFKKRFRELSDIYSSFKLNSENLTQESYLIQLIDKVLEITEWKSSEIILFNLIFYNR
jgi:hypothetical protein